MRWGNVRYADKLVEIKNFIFNLEYMLKILQALFWALLGGFIVTQFIVSFVIGPSDNDLAVYNLYDHLIPYTVFLAVGVLLFGMGFLIIKMIKRKA